MSESACGSTRPWLLCCASTLRSQTRGGISFSGAGRLFELSGSNMKIQSTIAIFALASAAAWTQPGGPKFYSDDPIRVEPETQDASKVAAVKIDLLYDLMLNQFSRPGLA